MSYNYWSKLLGRRLTRRRAMAMSGGAALSAAFLTACGKGEDKAGPLDTSGLLGSAADTTDKAVRGGVWPHIGADLTNGSIDPHLNSSQGGFAEITPVYSTLLKYGFATKGLPSVDKISGDAAQSWEQSPDGTVVTVRLRGNHKFDARPPTSSRAMNSADVKFSWDRAVGLSVLVAEVLAKNGGPIESLSTPDNQTVTIKLAYPDASIVELLAHYYLHVLPVEADGKFDPKSEARGSGPFTITRVEPSVRIEYQKNPDWYVKGRPFLDGITKINIPQYAPGLAQFENKALWDFGVRQEEILRVKKEHPEMILLPQIGVGSPRQQTFILSQRQDSPFRDVRVRRAASMLIDRDIFIDTFFNTAEFRKVGLPAKTYWDSHLAFQALNHLDPRSGDLGEGAKYFKYDPTEARKLMSAAGGLTEPVTYISRSDSASLFVAHPEVILNMWQEGGLKLDRQMLAVNAWRNHKESQGESYNGILLGTANAVNAESFLFRKYTPSGPDSISSKPIPVITDMVTKMRTELDTKKRVDLIKQIQRELAPLMLDIPMDNKQLGYSLHWPWLKNNEVFYAAGFSSDASSARIYTEHWYDASAKT